MSAVVVFSTFARREVAAEVARALVEERLAACVSLAPGVTSIYRWNDAIEESDEVLAIIKTTADRLDALRARLVALHPYELPEVIALPVAGGHAPYLAWIDAQTR
ncbi:MAG TPA: divalent-cation tolerance protein CutA [Kofleriaceae bacterium]|nr:divalent-cation tolerance protein CutA [Kofleriaceae bacterium]